MSIGKIQHMSKVFGSGVVVVVSNLINNILLFNSSSRSESLGVSVVSTFYREFE
jgi:hypothetical protein